MARLRFCGVYSARVLEQHPAIPGIIFAHMTFDVSLGKQAKNSRLR